MAFIDYIRAGESGVKGHQTRLNVISNNIANSGTVGFKRSFTQFFESFVKDVTTSTPSASNASTLDGISRGFGTDPVKSFVDGSSGGYAQTGNPLDLAIEDDGFFIVETGGEQYYTRDGNLSVDKDGNLIQVSTGSYVKGFVATLENDGTTQINTKGTLGRISFSQLTNLPSKPTSKVEFGSNLNGESQDRGMSISKNHAQLKDANGKILTFDARWKTIDEDSFEFQVRQNGQLAFTAELKVNHLGDIIDWSIPDQAGILVHRNPNEDSNFVSYSYNSEKEDGTFERRFVSVQLPSEVTKAGKRTLMDHSFFKGTPDDEQFQDQEPVQIGSEFNRGAVHKILSSVVDSNGMTHAISYNFEHVDTSENQWSYRVNLPVEDPLIQAYLKNPANGVETPDRPSEMDLERANNAIFGLSRIGNLYFDKKGMPDLEKSNIPRVSGNSAIMESVRVGSTTLNTATGEEALPLDIYATPEKNGFRYELLLPANTQNVMDLAKEPKFNLNSSESLTIDELRILNNEIFSGSNTGFINYDQAGNIDSGKSSFPKLRASLPQGEVNSEVSADLFKSLIPNIKRVSDETLGMIDMELDMSLISGLGGEFSTSVRNRNGYEEGFLKTTSITSNGDGKLVANYSNGELREVGQLGLAVFSNTGGLVRSGSNLFRLGNNTGINEDTIGAPDSSKRGLVQTGFLEQSNVDLINEFTNLIITQRAFQANSKVITTSDAILQTGIGIKR